MDVPPNKILHCLEKHKREMVKEDEYVSVSILVREPKERTPPPPPSLPPSLI
jgi:hypothetical protein